MYKNGKKIDKNTFELCDKNLRFSGFLIDCKKNEKIYKKKRFFA